MLRSDGAWVFFMIQHIQKTNHWVCSNLDKFGYPPGFKASDECWQKLGIHGCFDEEQARVGLIWIQDRHDPAHTFRLLRVNIIQACHPLSEPI